MNRKPNQKTSKRRINAVDAVIAIVFLLSLAASVYLTLSLTLANGESEGSGAPVEYSLVVENVDAARYGITLSEQTGSAECDFLKIGDRLFIGEDAKAIGKLVSIRYEPATGSTGQTDDNGTLIYAEYPGRVNLILTVRAELSGKSLQIGDLQLRVGKEISFHTAEYTASGKILSVDTEVE